MSKPILSYIADFMGQEPSEIMRLVKKAPGSYKLYRVPKKKGGMRTIYHPSKETKSIQYALLYSFLDSCLIHSSATAYVKDVASPLRRQAELHAKHAYSVRIDLKDFFPSIIPDDLFRALEEQEVVISADDKMVLSNALFIKNKHYSPHRLELPIGAPSSPMVSNIVMKTLDELISGWAIDHDGIYTRYADDIVFSSNAKGMCFDFYSRLTDILHTTTSPNVSINNDKTLYMSRGSRRVIVGLFITPSGEISVGRKHKRYIKKLLNDYKYGSLEPALQKYLAGYLSFILDVEPAFYSRLAIKYGDLVNNARSISV